MGYMWIGGLKKMSYLFAAIAYFLTSGLTIILLRRHFVQFADDIIKQLDELLAGRLEADALKYQDTLSDKVHHRMVNCTKSSPAVRPA